MQGMVDEAKAFLESTEGQDFEKDMQESFLAGSPSSQTQWAQRILAEKEKRQSEGNAGQGQDSTSGMNSGKLLWYYSMGPACVRMPHLDSGHGWTDSSW